MDERHRESAQWMRSQIRREQHDPSEFRAALLRVPPNARDAWIDVVLDLDALPEDGPDLPRGCVPYFPCSVDALLRVVEEAHVRESDVFVDIGAGQGRAAAVVHLLTGAGAIGIEIQSSLVRAARDLVSRLPLPRVSCVHGDAVKLVGSMTIGSVFFLYCPFSGDRLGRVVDDLEVIARTRTIRLCCVNLPLPHRPWLGREAPFSADLAVYRSTCLDARPGTSRESVPVL